MMMKKFLAVTTAAVMCVAAGSLAYAQDAEGHDGKRHMRWAGQRLDHDEFGDPVRMVEMMTRHLDLDESQSLAIGNILEAAKPEIDALRTRAQDGRQAMKTLDINDPDYGNELQNLSTEIGALTSAAILLHGRLRADVNAEMTPEQRQRAVAGRDRMREGFRRHLRTRPE